jgi:glyceraldehyde-3-phosphate dehydrogenase (NADP+)
MIQLDHPHQKDLQNELQINIPIIQDYYLVNGEIRKWNGAKEDVYSPVYYQNGEKISNYIGSYPAMTEKEAIEALDAATKAFDNCKGLWARMSVEQRIKHVLNFVEQMKLKRKEVF